MSSLLVQSCTGPIHHSPLSLIQPLSQRLHLLLMGFCVYSLPYIINCLRGRTVSYIVHCLSSNVSTLLRTLLTLKIHWTKGYPAFCFCSKDLPKFNAHRPLLSVMRQPGWEGSLGENGYIYMYGWAPLLSTWNYHNIVNWLYPIQTKV